MRPVVHVVAAALIDAGNRVLVAQRPQGKSLAGLWEFPGGKVEPAETPEAALVRELAEELGISVAAPALLPLGFVSHGYDDFHLVMLLYTCRDWTGVPVGQQGQPLRWEFADGLNALLMPPADLPFIATLKAFVAAA
jgi:8-oxo-dGTP diphosphatase